MPPLKSSEPDLVELGRAGFCLASCVRGRLRVPRDTLCSGTRCAPHWDFLVMSWPKPETQEGPAAAKLFGCMSLEEGEEECGEQLRHEEGEQEVRDGHPSALSPWAPWASSSAKVLAAIQASITLAFSCSHAGRELLQSHPSQQPRGEPCRGGHVRICIFLEKYRARNHVRNLQADGFMAHIKAATFAGGTARSKVA